jgi:adenine deaminase
MIAVAQGLSAPDLLVRNARVWNVFTGELRPADIAICGERIAKVGEWDWPVDSRTEVVDAAGLTAVPGYIEPHTHPWPFANPLSLGEMAVSRGTTTLVYDQLMLTLAMGPERLAGITAELSRASLPHIFWMARINSQSRFEDEVRIFDPDVIHRQVRSDWYLGSAEMTRWADLLDERHSPHLLSILEDCRSAGKINDGHFAGASPRKLAALALAGIRSCHEATTAEEALERLRQGIWVLLRNSSLREDLTALLPMLAQTRFHDRIALTTDGAGEPHVENHGLIDHMIRMALDAGVSADIAYRMATLNAATLLGLDEDLGAVAPGRIANVNLLTDLDQPSPQLVVCRGRLAAREGQLLVAPPSASFAWDKIYSGGDPDIPAWEADKFLLPQDAPNPFPGGRLVNGAITRETPAHLQPRDNGLWPSDPDALVLAVTGRGGHWITRGVVQNMGARIAAVGSTYTTNAGVVVLGKSPEAMAEAMRRLKRMGGGIVVASVDGNWSEFPLPMGGIHSKVGFSEAARAARTFVEIMRACGYEHSDPKYTLLFLTCDMLPDVRAVEAGWFRVKSSDLLYAAEALV